MNQQLDNCPCGNDLLYADCCGGIHNKLSVAITAEALMRSRYTAFTMAKGDYLMLSHHLKTRPSKQEMRGIVAWAKTVVWNHLEIINTTLGGELDSNGTVEFKAFYYEGLKLQFIHENSKFVKEKEIWVYTGIV